MIPPDGIRLSGQKCWECCVAAIMERPAGTIVDVHARNWSSTDQPWEWWGIFLDWLWEQDWKISQYIPKGEFPKGFVIAVGSSPRRPNKEHAVILKDGELAFDPYLDDPIGVDWYTAIYKLEPIAP